MTDAAVELELLDSPRLELLDEEDRLERLRDDWELLALEADDSELEEDEDWLDAELELLL